jgi:magnesium chelatase family protein
LLDRIDIHIKMAEVTEAEFRTGEDLPICMSTKQMRDTVLTARALSVKRNPDQVPNAGLNAEGVRRVCMMEKEAEKLLTQAYEYYSLSVRARSKLVKVARTIADLSGDEMMTAVHSAEAIAYRPTC